MNANDYLYEHGHPDELRWRQREADLARRERQNMSAKKSAVCDPKPSVADRKLPEPRMRKLHSPEVEAARLWARLTAYRMVKEGALKLRELLEARGEVFHRCDRLPVRDMRELHEGPRQLRIGGVS